jgi:hypothetical protein
MGRRSATILGRSACYAAVVGATALACAIAFWPAGEDSDAAPRQQAEASIPDISGSIDALRAVTPAPANDEYQRALFSPHPMIQVPQVPAPQQVAAAWPPPAEPVKPAVAAPARPKAPAASRHTTVLNDAQIASIKQRLNLTPEQERMWPAVEVALRKLGYAKKNGGQPHAPTLPTELAGGDVQNLKSAATPLIMSFSQEQERELRLLAQIAGLEKLIPGKESE